MGRAHTYDSSDLIYSHSEQKFNGLTYTSHQHQETTLPRVKRDYSDLKNINGKLVTCTPFLPEPFLRDIATAVIARKYLTVHSLEMTRKKILRNIMVRELIFEA